MLGIFNKAIAGLNFNDLVISEFGKHYKEFIEKMSDSLRDFFLTFSLRDALFSVGGKLVEIISRVVETRGVVLADSAASAVSSAEETDAPEAFNLQMSV